MRRARRTNPVRVSEDQRRAKAAPDVREAVCARVEGLGTVTYDRVLICDLTETFGMFTLLVSWLLVACVPGLLMLATLGLARLERLIARETDMAAHDIDDIDVDELTIFARHLGGGDEELPSRIQSYSRDNPLYRATKHINRV